jgi:hypothetical protein
MQSYENVVGRSDHKKKILCDTVFISIHARSHFCPIKQTLIQSTNFHETCNEYHDNKGYSISENFVLPSNRTMTGIFLGGWGLKRSRRVRLTLPLSMS